jgi:hypothetical protein
MGYLVNPISGTIETFSFSLDDSQITTMGSNPITINFDTGIAGQYVYIPLNAFFIKISGSTPYDFGAPDHPVINQGLTYSIFQWYEPLQNYNSSVDIAFSTLTQRNVSLLTHATGINYKIGVPNFSLTTSTGNDATVGDFRYTLYITTYKLTF